MSKLRCHISISLDGYVAGPNQSLENPLGKGGERLHDWGVVLAAWRETHGIQGGEANESTRIMAETFENVGAGLMGRNMFGPAHGGDWGDEPWNGWWGDDPPYHNDVFILTHHPRDAVEMKGGTTFHFVTDGIVRALEQAREAANAQDVRLWGGAQAIQQYLAAGLLDVLELHIVPVLLGGGARLFGEPRGSRGATGTGAGGRGARGDTRQVPSAIRLAVRHQPKTCQASTEAVW